MTIKELDKIIKNIQNAIYKHKIALAFSLTRTLFQEESDWNLQSKFEEIEMLYKQMISYKLKGVHDAGQTELLTYLEATLLNITEKLSDKIKIRTSDSYLYKQKRNARTAYNVSASTIETISNENNSNECFSEEFNHELDNYFKHIAFSENISKEDIKNIELILNNETTLPLIKSLTISAILLNILSVYNSDLLGIIISMLAKQQEAEIKARLDVSLVLIISHYKDRISLDTKNYNSLLYLIDNKEFIDNIEYVYSQIVRTYENKSITKKIQEELLPEMIKLNSKDIFKIGNDDEDEFNPNWQESLENSSIGDKLREFGDLQLSGADVYVSTFSQLKSYGFFYNISNWFIPFDTKHSSVYSIFKDQKDLFTVLAKSSQLCNSDKYSFFITLASMPQSQIEMLTGSMAEQITQMKEDISDENWKETTVEYKQIIRQYIQDLYRFYNLFPNRNDFESPFDEALNLYTSNIYKTLFPASETRYRLSEFFFEKDCYEHSANMFESLEKEIVPETDFYQKMGYAFFKCSKYNKAINAYLESLQIQHNDVWTLKALVRCYKYTNNIEQYLYYTQQLYNISPENTKIIIQLSNIYYEIEDYNATLKLLHKLDYLQPNNTNTLRKLLDVSLRLKDVEKCEYYMSILLNINDINKTLEPSDHINMAYISLYLNKQQEAIHHLKNLYKHIDQDIEKFYLLALNSNLIKLLEQDEAFVKIICESIIILDNPETLIDKN